MRILFHVPSYYPNIGGVEVATLNLVEQLTALGQQVVVITKSEREMESSTYMGSGGFRIESNPSLKKLFKWTCWCDVVVHANVNMRTIWPLYLVRRPWVVIHHHRLRQLVYSAGTDGKNSGKDTTLSKSTRIAEFRLSLNDRVKRYFASQAHSNIAVSPSLAEDLPFPTFILPNCYDETTFIVCSEPSKSYERDVIFVGRFVSEKCPRLILEALALLRKQGVFMNASFVGDGPEREVLLDRIRKLEIDNQVQFTGSAEGRTLAKLFSEHKICVIASVVPETFGLVALEAMACGCAILSSDDGAVPWVAGEAGTTFKSGDVQSLATQLRLLHEEKNLVTQLRSNSALRVKAFAPGLIAKKYVHLIKAAADMAVLTKLAYNPSRLRILVISPFYPNIGGMETVFRLLVREWERLGHEVRVIHPVEVKYHSSFEEVPSTPIYFQPAISTSMALHQWADIVMHGSLNTRYLPVLLLSGKPFIITQHGSVTPTGLAPLSFIQKLKRWVSRRFPNITCSKFVADDLGIEALATGNPYQDDIFQTDPEIPRVKDLIFVGRLVSDKGLTLLIRALKNLHDQRIFAKLSVIGTGPQMELCEALVSDLGLQKSVAFMGVMSPVEVAANLRQHRILVVPSAFWEPFGIVALEGIACGCMVVASKGGGMPESVGQCGILFENNSLEGLTSALKEALEMQPISTVVREHHLAQYRAPKIAHNFLTAMYKVIGSQKAHAQ